MSICVVCGVRVRSDATFCKDCKRHSWNKWYKEQPRTWRIWDGMIKRCKYESATDGRYYKKGIFVCDNWKSYEGFLSEMGECPSDEHTLDRKDNNQGYFKDNCRWATRREQQNNISSNRNLTYNGETLSCSGWARRFDMSPQCLYQRLKKGWSIEDALTTPKQR